VAGLAWVCRKPDEREGGNAAAIGRVEEWYTQGVGPSGGKEAIVNDGILGLPEGYVLAPKQIHYAQLPRSIGLRSSLEDRVCAHELREGSLTSFRMVSRSK